MAFHLDYYMKRIVVSLIGLAGILIIAGTYSTTAIQNVFGTVKATPYGDEILLQWETLNENGIRGFEVERKSDESTEFRKLIHLDSKGTANSYRYVDDGAFFKPTAGKRFTYRVKAVGSSFYQYSSPISITHEVSSVRKSWGMIKELFR